MTQAPIEPAPDGPHRSTAVGNRRAPGLLAGALVLLLVLSLQSAAAPIARAQGSVVADEYSVDLAIQPDGNVAVVERLTLDFSGNPFRHGSSSIELRRVEDVRNVLVGESGRDYRLVGEATREPGTYTVRRDRERLIVEWWFPATRDGSRTFEIRYQAVGAIRIYPSGDQLYWPAIERDRRYPIREARATVRLPADVTRQQVLAAAYPERLDARFELLDPRTAQFTARNLTPGQGLVVRLRFPSGMVPARPPTWQAAADRADWTEANLEPALNFLMLLLGLLIPALGLVWIGVRWSTQGRDPSIATGAPVLTTRPDDLPAPVVGTLLDERADQHDVVAAVVDLANRGVLRVTPLPGEGPNGSTDYRIERLTTDEAKLRDYERQLLIALFGEGTEARMSRVAATFAGTWPALQAALYQEVVRAGLFAANPEQVRRQYRLLGGALVVVAVAAGIFVGGWLAAYSDLALLPFAGLLLVGLVLLIVAGHMPRRTRAGALAASRWAAFRRHLQQQAAGKTPAERETFARYLPYATAFGLDREWVNRFAVTAPAPRPEWYGGGPGPVIVVGGPPWGAPYGGGWGGPHPGGGAASGGSPPTAESTAAPGGGGLSFPAGPAGLGEASDSLADMLNRASDVFAQGGGSPWSGGGAGDIGGWSGSVGGDYGGGGGDGSGFD